MKKLIFIALMFGFLVGNAQQNAQHSGLNNTREEIQSGTYKHPGIRSEVDQYRNKIAKPLNALGLPFESDPYMNEMMRPDNHPGLPFESELYEKEIMKTDSELRHPSKSYKYLKTSRKTN
jgi:hypothetical protein